MGLSLPCFVAGERIDPSPGAPRLSSLDGRVSFMAAEVSAAQLRRAIRHGELCQARLARASLAERIAAARAVLSYCAERSDEACLALAHLRGIVVRDTRWTCTVLEELAAHLDLLAERVFGSTPSAGDADASGGRLSFHSKGAAAIFSSSTMDGPAAVVALAHAMISGTHVILKPSYRDGATHLALEAMHALGLTDYAQLVRWQSGLPEARALNRTLLRNVQQALVFSANETHRALLDDVAPPRSDEWDALYARTKRYGTGLPLAVVTSEADLDQAASDLVEGARLGGGRFCLSACPVLVEARCQDALAARLRARASDLRRGAPLDPSSDLPSHDAETAEGMRAALRSFGGMVAWGEVREHDMDLVVLRDVRPDSACLHRELPGPVLALVPVADLTHARDAAVAALRRNQREAWTAIVSFSSACQHDEMRDVPSYRYLRGGVVSRVKLLLPHQGAYFAHDLMRRVSIE